MAPSMMPAPQLVMPGGAGPGGPSLVTNQQTTAGAFSLRASIFMETVCGDFMLISC